MSRSGYSDDLDDNWQLIRWRGAVASAIRGKRGQAFLREMLTAFDQLGFDRLIAGDLERDGGVCSLGAVGRQRGVEMGGVDPKNYDAIAKLFGIPHSLAQEIMFLNDEWSGDDETPEARFQRMRKWIAENIKP